MLKCDPLRDPQFLLLSHTSCEVQYQEIITVTTLHWNKVPSSTSLGLQ